MSVTLKCLQCQNDYEALRASSKFCSPKCRVYHKRGLTGAPDVPAEKVVVPEYRTAEIIKRVVAYKDAPIATKVIEFKDKHNNIFACSKCGSIKIAGKCNNCRR